MPDRLQTERSKWTSEAPMPYDITTRDGITIRNIPDETPADSPELKQRVATLRQQLNPKPTERQELLSSAPMRLAKGGADTITGAAQLAERLTPGSGTINRAADSAGNWLNENVFNKMGLPGNFAGDVLGIRGMTPEQFREDIKASEGEYQAARQATAPVSPQTGERDPGFDGMRLAGNIASPVSMTIGRFAPALRAGSTLGNLAFRGSVGGAAGAAVQPVEDENYAGTKVGQVATGAVAGAALGPLITRAGESAARVVQRWIGNRASNVTPERIQQMVRQQLEADGVDVSTLPQQVFQGLSDDVRAALAHGRELDPAAALRARDFQALNLPFTRGQVGRDPAQWQREFNLSGVENVGEPLQQLFQQQSQGIGRRMGQAAAGAGEVFDDAGRLMEVTRAAQGVRDQNVRDAYAAFRDANGRDMQVPLAGLADEYRNVLRTFGDNVPRAVRERFESLGLLTGDHTVPNALMGRTSRADITTAEDLIRTINSNYNPANRPEKAALDRLRVAVQQSVENALDNGNVDNAMAAQLGREARQFASENFRFQEQTPGLRAVMQGMEPDQFIQRYVIRGNVNDIERLGQAAGPEGQEIMRRQFADYLRSKAFGANAAGDGKAAQATFNSELQKIGRPKLVALLGEDGAEEMLRIGRVLAYIKQVPEGATPNTSGTGQMLTSLMGRTRGLQGLPFVNDYVVRPLARYADRREVASALQQIPSQPTQLDPETIRRMATLFSGVPVAGGVSSSKPIR
jgi:hypothetical protein